MSADAVRKALTHELGLAVGSVQLTAGGDINDAYRAETDRGSIFVKTSPHALPGMFTDEAAGLEWLAAPGAIKTPAVVGVVDPVDASGAENPTGGPGSGGTTRLLALHWIDRGRLGPRGEEELGRGLAAIHAAGAPSFGATPTLVGDGYAHAPMRFNQLELPNDPCDSWAEFYAQRRLLPLARASLQRGSLDSDDVALIERVCERVAQLAGPPEPPARIHGDLWSGNVMADSSGAPVLIDPVAHGGHRELDLAVLKVFGGPSQRCFDAYDEAAPLAPGHEERTQLWQLAMILLHVYLFGGGYVAQARAIARRYA
jgi:fructosamine-3-kinase